MSLTLSPSNLKEYLAKAIPARRPVLITGQPGIGKSDIVTEACLLANTDLLISHPALADPTDAKGMPWIAEDKKSATFLPFGDLMTALHATRPLAWFLDDIGQASPAVQASYMQLLRARRVNGHVLPDCVTFIGATNRRTDRAGVSGLIEPVKSRFTIVGLEANLDDFCSWGLDHGIAVEIIAFLRFRPDLLCQFNPTQDLVNQPCPRTWEFASHNLSLGLSPKIELAAISGDIGEGAASEFIGFLRVYRELPSLDGILLDPDKAIIPTSPAALYAVSCGLASKATPTNFPRIATYAGRLQKAQKGEFGVLMLRDAIKRDPAICNTPAFIKLVAGDMGKLISGEQN
jgi:hypothetical protein